jgi:long-chain acyl-CoA synthetase
MSATQPSAAAFAWSHSSQIPLTRGDASRPALADSRRSLTRGELADEVRRLAGALAEHGIKAGDVVATMLPNRSELATVMLAAWRIGAAMTPINPTLTADEAGYQLADSGSRLVVVDDASGSTLAESGVAQLHVDDLASLTGDDVAHPGADDELALLIYTSGTTGRPKGVMLTHANVRAMLWMLVEHFRVTDADRALVGLPLFHVNGLMVSVLMPLAVGGSTVLLERFSKSTFWSEVERARPTYFSLVPAMYLMFNAMAPDVKPDTSSMRFCICGAAPVPPEALKTFRERYGIPIIEAYGLSETSVGVSINPLDGPQKAGSVGPALNGVEIKTVDDDGDPTPAGEPGEVVVRGPNVMQGYLGKPDETAKALKDGWLRTGDVGYLDEDGYLFLVDRKKDMIIRGGENVYPTEIENVIARHPAVAEIAVVGRPDAVLGEVPFAFAVLKPGESATSDELLAYGSERLARYKGPVEVSVVEALPRNPVGKVAKPQLRERLRAN